MRNLTCIVCPVGCSLDVEDNTNELSVTGYKCPRGEKYAQEEIRSPKRVVTATVSLTTNQTNENTLELNGSIRRLPVKTSSPCPREMIPALLDAIYKVKVSLPVKAGDVIIAGWKPVLSSDVITDPFWQGKGIDVVATRSVG